MRYTTDGKGICNFSLATSDNWKDKETGERRERTERHRVVVFGKLAEICGEYLSKGKLVYIEGRLQTRKWQGQDGQDRYTTEIVVDIGGTMQMLSPKDGGWQADGHGQQGAGGGYQRPQGGTNANQLNQRPRGPQNSAPNPGQGGPGGPGSDTDFYGDGMPPIPGPSGQEDNDIPF